jgi:hypothetical protein
VLQLALAVATLAPLADSRGNVPRTAELGMQVAIVLSVPRVPELGMQLAYVLPKLHLSPSWTFVLDGHQFYVLNLGNVGTYVYDTTTQRWSNWSTQGWAPAWNFLFGNMWGESRIVGADAVYGILYEMDPSAVLDEGWREIYHEVTAFITARGRSNIRLDDLRIVGSSGYLDAVNGATITLQYSDDNGTTWSAPRNVTLTEAHTFMEIAWRSLGAFHSPGRIFSLQDSGGLLRIDGADWNTNAAPPQPASSPPQQQGGQS